jgi:hypothetical protein
MGTSAAPAAQFQKDAAASSTLREGILSPDR